MPSKLSSKADVKTFAAPAPKTPPAPQNAAPREIPENYVSLPVDIIAFESNIRQKYDEESIAELAESMKTYGQLQPCRVYEKGARYIVVFGHRRLLAAKQAGLAELKCVITGKPDTVDTIYIQAVENEQKEDVSSSDREKYITLLKQKGQTVGQIAQKMGKSKPWVYQALEASEIRTRHEKTFNEADISMTTYDTRMIKNADEEDVKKAVGLIAENPSQKHNILEQLNEKTKKRKGSRARDEKKKIKAFPEEPELSGGGGENAPREKEIQLTVTVYLNEDDKRVRFKQSVIGDVYDSKIIPYIRDRLAEYYGNNGYTAKI